MFRDIVIVNPEGAETTLRINKDNIVFLSDVDLPSNIKGLDGILKTNKGSSLALANGMCLNSPLTVDEIEELFKLSS